jgi:hypothetical protein
VPRVLPGKALRESCQQGAGMRRFYTRWQAPCIQEHCQLVTPRKSQPLEVAFQRERAVEISFDIDLAAKVGIGQQHRAAGGDEAAQQHRVTQHKRERRRPLTHAVGAVIPQAQIGTADETAQQSLQDAQGSIGMRVLNNGK